MTYASLQNPPVITVTQLTQAIKLSLEESFPLIFLQGEVSNCKLHTSGHLYFSLKDAQSQIGAVMFRPEASTLKVPVKDGMQVLVRGELNVFAAAGKYQLVVKELRPLGLGELLVKLEELKIKLNKKGWFKADHKKKLPKFPRRIGVVTSPTGAAIHDILNVLTRRFSGFQLLINPVHVQGEGAAQEISQAIRQFNEFDLVDVMIVGRGGGSIEDLWAFNEEIVAEAIYNSRIPIISAVGHESDHCIADYVADVRAPTPSAAAEMVIAEKSHQLQHLNTVRRRLEHSVSHLIRKDRQRLVALFKHPLLRSPYGILGPWTQKLDDYRQQLDHATHKKIEKWQLKLEGKHKQLNILNPVSKLQHLHQKLNHLKRGLIASIVNQIRALRGLFNENVKLNQLNGIWQRQLKLNRERVEQLTSALASIDPKNLLSQGYCILFSEKDHSAITSIREIRKDQEIRLMLSDGEAVSTVKQIFPK